MKKFKTLEDAKALAHEVLVHAQENDDEAAHAAENQLRIAALTWIVEHAGDHRCANMAAIALSTQAIDFQRWCA